MTCPECGGPLRATRMNFGGAAGEHQPMPTGTDAWACDKCQTRWFENADGQLQKVPE